MVNTRKREERALELIRDGYADSTINMLTGYPPSVIRQMRLDLSKLNHPTMEGTKADE